jgi:hypothetical protein
LFWTFAWLEGGCTLYLLEFTADLRNCWTSILHIGMKWRVQLETPALSYLSDTEQCGARIEKEAFQKVSGAEKPSGAAL